MGIRIGLVSLRTGSRPPALPAGFDSPEADQLLLPDLILAEVAYVLESFYETPRSQVADTLRAVLAFQAIQVVDAELLQRAVEIYDAHRLDFADAYLVASAERTGVAEIASFDRAIDRVGTVRRVEPE